MHNWHEIQPCVINDPLGQTHIISDHYLDVTFVLLCDILKNGDELPDWNMCENNDHYRSAL